MLLECVGEELEVLDTLLDDLEHVDGGASAHLHVVEVARGLHRDILLQRDQKLRCTRLLTALLKQVLYGHQDLTMFGGLLHLLGGDLLVFGNLPAFGILKLL